MCSPPDVRAGDGPDGGLVDTKCTRTSRRDRLHSYSAIYYPGLDVVAAGAGGAVVTPTWAVVSETPTGNTPAVVGVPTATDGRAVELDGTYAKFILIAAQAMRAVTADTVGWGNRVVMVSSMRQLIRFLFILSLSLCHWLPCRLRNEDYDLNVCLSLG